jgi:hypothetical protein
VRDVRTQRYVVRSTRETSRILARAAAVEFARSLWGNAVPTPREMTFRHYVARFIDKGRRWVQAGERNANYVRTTQIMINNTSWGLLDRFGARDVRDIGTRDWLDYIAAVARSRPDLSASTRNMLMATFSNVLKMARDDGVIDRVPDTPRERRRDNPRPFFRFHSLVARDQDAYQRLLAMAVECQGEVIRGVAITSELHDLIVFLVHSFVRPTTTELYALRHADVQPATNPTRLLVTVRDGKTGFRVANTTAEAVPAWRSLCQRYPEAGPGDHLFLPGYANRATAARIFARQFNHVLERAGIKHDAITGADHTLYSLRHTAICRRIILSEGRVSIYNLARNAGTSVDQIERFYARNLPLSAELARNLAIIVAVDEAEDEATTS